jgi:hypothetical protein
MRYAYTGEKVPWWLPTSLYEGYLDGCKYKLPAVDQLYRWGFLKKLFWRIGFFTGKHA